MAGSIVQDTITAIPSKILFVFVTLFLFYYLLKDGDRIINLIFTIFSVSRVQKKKLITEFRNVTYGVVYGQVITAIFQGCVATIGYVIFDVKLPFLVGFITIFFAFLPMLGTAIVWLPISVFFLAQGNYLQGFGLLIYGIFIISLVDNFIRPKLISGKTKMHPALVLLGVVSGLQAFGILGLFIGPLFIAAGKELLKYYLGDLTPRNFKKSPLTQSRVRKKTKVTKRK